MSAVLPSSSKAQPPTDDPHFYFEETKYALKFSGSNCNQIQAWLPAAVKGNTLGAGADAKESGLSSGAATWKLGDSRLKAHLLGRWGTHVTKSISIFQ